MSTTTIQINSKEALERLLGGDTQLEIEARNSIVQNFTKKYLKSIASLDVVKNQANKIRQEVSTIVAEKVSETIGIIEKDYYGGVKKITLRPEIQESLKQAIDSYVYELIRKTVEDKVNGMNITKLIQDSVEASVAYRIREGVKKRLDEVSKTI